MKLSIARQQLTQVANTVSNTKIDESPEDAGRNWTPEQATEINEELKAIEEQIDALRRKLYNLES